MPIQSPPVGEGEPRTRPNRCAPANNTSQVRSTSCPVQSLPSARGPRIALPLGGPPRSLRQCHQSPYLSADLRREIGRACEEGDFVSENDGGPGFAHRLTPAKLSVGLLFARLSPWRLGIGDIESD